MAQARSKRTTPKRPARSRRSKLLKRMMPEDRALALRLSAVVDRANLKRDDMIREGFDRIARSVRKGDHAYVMQHIVRIGEQRGLLMTAARRQAAKKGGSR